MLSELSHFARKLRAFNGFTNGHSRPLQAMPAVARRPRPFSTAEFPVLDPSQPIEEEIWPWYDPKDYYPVRIGDVFQSRYQVTGKLGYGGYSTAWLCRDLV